MISNTAKGKLGEEKAKKYLCSIGYIFLEQNYRYNKAEIDLILNDGEVLVFVEVKYRSGLVFGLPEEAVNEKKMDLLREAAENYIIDKNWEGEIRFDIVAISKKDELFHIIDAF